MESMAAMKMVAEDEAACRLSEISDDIKDTFRSTHPEHVQGDGAEPRLPRGELGQVKGGDDRAGEARAVDENHRRRGLGGEQLQLLTVSPHLCGA